MPIARIVMFLGVVLSVVGGIHYYLWARLVRDVAWPAPMHTALTVLLIALAAGRSAALRLALPESAALDIQVAP